ncbi:two-component sensor histidine kinase [Loktanella sp. D2R18]|uniref:ATP-binding protein n=1 Tax=Rhodobacterales TaxID=204455 RepID=UPI000DEAA942|nr:MULTISPECIES: ATP-binding protein [Rhodobacterales]MDO6591617.1 ATP-binding protein [Yoonia sp. 1_MG-2023]RBW43733.1 two-component sensor histidine kinase [Loktanella sp. D2R18]
MIFRWLKTYMPRGIYARAALILILPVLLLQLLISVVFIQRHFEGVTQLMTSAEIIDLDYMIESVNAAPDIEAAGEVAGRIGMALQIAAVFSANDIPSQDQIPFVDLTGSSVIATLRNRIDPILAVSLADRRVVVIWIETRHGPLRFEFSRRRVSASNPHQLLVIMVVMGAFMTAIAFIFLRNQLRPIKRMAKVATDYGRGRITNFTPTGAVEVRAAGTAFLDMRNRLERQIQSRTLMLSGVSHDLRTPLTRMRLGLSFLDEEDAAPLIEDVDEMQRLLDAFLDFARSDASDEIAHTAPGDIVRGVLASHKRMGDALTLDRIEGGDIPVPLRPTAIRRALDNLVGNALRYGDRAQIGVSVTDRAVRFWVADDGPGIPPEQYDNAMSPFVRLDPARNQDKGSGVGLGLSIVADIARTHGGVLRLSRCENLGGLKAELVIGR